MYEAEITFHQGTGREYTYEQTCPSLESAVEQIESWARGMFICRAWINNKEVAVRNGRVVGNDGELLCINPKWHEVFAKPSEQIPPKFRPQSTRGTGPTNPATLGVKGML